MALVLSTPVFLAVAFVFYFILIFLVTPSNTWVCVMLWDHSWWYSGMLKMEPASQQAKQIASLLSCRSDLTIVFLRQHYGPHHQIQAMGPLMVNRHMSCLNLNMITV